LGASSIIVPSGLVELNPHCQTKPFVKQVKPLHVSNQVVWWLPIGRWMWIYKSGRSKSTWSILPIPKVIRHTWVAFGVKEVDEGVSLAAAGIVSAVEKAVLISSKGGKADIAPFMTAYTWLEFR
jgi:hypothetical protein